MYMEGRMARSPHYGSKTTKTGIVFVDLRSFIERFMKNALRREVMGLHAHAPISRAETQIHHAEHLEREEAKLSRHGEHSAGGERCG